MEGWLAGLDATFVSCQAPDMSTQAARGCCRHMGGIGMEPAAFLLVLADMSASGGLFLVSGDA